MRLLSKRRRLAVLVSLLGLLLPAVVACGDGVGPSRSLLVLGPWLNDTGVPDDESDVFRQVLEAYAAKNDLDITYQGTRAIGQVLAAKVRDGRLPDIAILPAVGELVAFATEDLAQPVTPVLPEGTPTAAKGKVLVDHRALWRGDRAFAVAVKTDLKSLIIRRPDTNVPRDLKTPPPKLAPKWCLGLSAAAAPGWPGTDWIEDLLLQSQGYQAYEGFASGETSWASTDPVWRRFAGHLGPAPEMALLTSPLEAADALAGGTCDLMHQSSFYAPPGSRITRSGPQFEVSADFAARFTTNPAAEDLLRFLTDGDEWVAAGHGRVLSLDPDPAAYDPPRDEVAKALRAADRRCLDASDAMPATMAEAFQKAVLEFVADPDRLDHLPALLGRLDDIRAQTGDEWVPVRCSA